MSRIYFDADECSALKEMIDYLDDFDHTEDGKIEAMNEVIAVVRFKILAEKYSDVRLAEEANVRKESDGDD